MRSGTTWVSRWERLLRTHALRAGRRDLIRTEEDLLAPGLYLRSGETVWRHWRARLPDHLRLSKSGQGHASASPRQRISSTVQRWLPPLALRVGRDSRGPFTIAVAADDGGLVLLAQDRGQVARTYGSREIDSDYVALRRRYERHLPTPSFEVAGEGRLIVEEFVVGRHFAELAPSHQVDVAKEVFARYTSLTRDESEGFAQDWVEESLRAVREGNAPAEVAQLLQAEGLPLSSPQWPTVPSATDASVKNVIVRPDGSPVLIDLGNLRLDPFFYYPVGLVAMARGHVLEQFLTGDLDAELNELYAAAGARPPLGEDGKKALLALRLAMTSHREAVSHGPFDQTVFDAALARRWSSLWSGRPASFS